MVPDVHTACTRPHTLVFDIIISKLYLVRVKKRRDEVEWQGLFKSEEFQADVLLKLFLFGTMMMIRNWLCDLYFIVC